MTYALLPNGVKVVGVNAGYTLSSDAPSDRIAWIDGYGNIKTTIPASSVLLKPESKKVIAAGWNSPSEAAVLGSDSADRGSINR